MPDRNSSKVPESPEECALLYFNNNISFQGIINKHKKIFFFFRGTYNTVYYNDLR